MATIVEFRQPGTKKNGSDAARATGKLRKGRSAEIIIFPGVRIERHTDMAASRAVEKPKERAKRTVRRKQ